MHCSSEILQSQIRILQPNFRRQNLLIFQDFLTQIKLKQAAAYLWQPAMGSMATPRSSTGLAGLEGRPGHSPGPDDSLPNFILFLTRVDTQPITEQILHHN
ncbi:hypothetical protein Fot_34430 [Forsythia ovata]|uniref:Uncharacterized protein n=1 Tax=Forsythia ovata TaxID=205694 RepID=A0ABD1SIN6_9LAMI